MIFSKLFLVPCDLERPPAGNPPRGVPMGAKRLSPLWGTFGACCGNLEERFLNILDCSENVLTHLNISNYLKVRELFYK